MRWPAQAEAVLEETRPRAIDVHQGDKVDETALKDLIRAAVALNLEGASEPKSRRTGRKRPIGAVAGPGSVSP